MVVFQFGVGSPTLFLNHPCLFVSGYHKLTYHLKDLKTNAVVFCVCLSTAILPTRSLIVLFNLREDRWFETLLCFVVGYTPSGRQNRREHLAQLYEAVVNLQLHVTG